MKIKIFKEKQNKYFNKNWFLCAGNIYKMSRNKDRYESSNQRRQQVFMSQEDVAAGRKSNWTGVEITGKFQIIHFSNLNFDS